MSTAVSSSTILLSSPLSSPSTTIVLSVVPSSCPFLFNKFPSYPQSLYTRRKRRSIVLAKSSEGAEDEDGVSITAKTDEWLKRLPEKNKPLYAHSLPCIEAWLRNLLGFYQSKDDRAVWFVEKPDWHAQLSLDVTDLYIRYLKSGPGNLEKDIERRFSYALSREDIENAILGGP